MPKLTDWYSGSQHPVRDGWYERDYTGILGENFGIHLDMWIQYSPGIGFWSVNEPRGQINDAYYERLPWRGLTARRNARGGRD